MSATIQVLVIIKLLIFMIRNQCFKCNKCYFYNHERLG